ncbi:MAG: DUF4097 family beta strand repeat-containing protein [Mycobacteriales bacterium]
MPTFDTPEPISVTLDLIIGGARIAAADRADTVVQVRPSDPGRDADVRAADQTTVEYAAGRLLVKVPKPRGFGIFNKVPSVDVTIELPAGSQVRADAQIVTFRGTGRLGDCRVKTSLGDIAFEHTGALDLTTGVGAVEVDRAAGRACVTTGSGRVRVGAVDGDATIKNSNGDTWIGAVTGDLRANSANGDIDVDRADADVTASTANGDVRVGALARGVASLKTSLGRIHVGIRAGTAARLDAYTHFGRVDNQLDVIDSPAPSDQTVEVQARTSYGDIVIHRAGSPEKEPA